MGSIAVLLIALIVIIVVMLSSPDRNEAQKRRSTAVKTLLSRNSDADMPNMNQIARSLGVPISAGGSLNNLNHFLTKDPGRRDFSGAGDRRKAREYLMGPVGVQAESNISELRNADIPPWAPDFAGTVKALFGVVKDDILIITGVPASLLTSLERPESDMLSVTLRSEIAVGQFASTWIPRGEMVSLYEPDRQVIRSYLMGDKRFVKRLEALDSGWVELTAALYNLSINPRWLSAVEIAPELGKELEELIILVLSADIQRRSVDLMGLVSGDSSDAGILWLPNFSYYKNIPEVTGQTSDSEPTIFFAKVNLGYTFRDSDTQSWLNRRKDWLTDYFSAFFTGVSSEDFSPIDEKDQSLFVWKTAMLKAEALHGINSRIVATMPLGRKGTYGVRDVAFVRVNLLANP